MSRKLLCLLWCIIACSGCYVIIAIMANFKTTGKLIYMNGLDAFYRDIGMRGLDRDLLIRQSLHVESSFQGMISEEPYEEEIHASDKVERHIKLSESGDSLVRKVYKVDKDKDLSNVTKVNATEKHKESMEKLAAERRLNRKYYKLKNTRVNPFDFEFIESGENIQCGKDEKPFLVILCLSKFYDIETRQAIRDTWGSVAKTKRWPGVAGGIPDVKLVFLLGGHENLFVKKAIVKDEKDRFGDIVVADFKDSYGNLTLKVMMGLKWVTDFCPLAKFVVKIDQDTFLHVANLLTFLQFKPIPDEGLIIGFENVEPKVYRTGRWGVDRTTFPMSRYPNYTNGNCYVISGNVVRDLFDAAEHMPYIWVEDVFITGIVRTVLGVKIQDHKGFTRWNAKPPRLCGFHNGVRIAATNTDNERKQNLWKALTYVNLRNCYDIKKFSEN